MTDVPDDSTVYVMLEACDGQQIIKLTDIGQAESALLQELSAASAKGASSSCVPTLRLLAPSEKIFECRRCGHCQQYPLEDTGLCFDCHWQES